MKSKEEEAANKAIQLAQTMIGDLDYEGAKAKIQEAINVFPTIQNGKEMILVCEILHLCETHKYFQEKTFPYSILQLPTSSTESQVLSRYVMFMAVLKAFQLKEGTFSSAAEDAIRGLNFAMFLYKQKYPNPLEKEIKDCHFSGALFGFDCEQDRKIKTHKDKIAAKHAIKAIEDAKSLISDKQDFKSAIAAVELAIKNFPEINFGKEMLNVCNLLYNFNKYKSSSGEIWSSVLQIPSSSTESEFKARYKELSDSKAKLCEYQQWLWFPGMRFASEALRQSRASFRRCKAVVSEENYFKLDKKRKASCKDTAAVSAPAATELEMMSNIFDPKSPEFKKLCKEILDWISQVLAEVLKLPLKQFNSGDHNLEFLTDEQITTIRAVLKEMKAHGCNVESLEERVDLMARIAELAKEGESCEEKAKQSEGQIGEEMVQLEKAKLEVETVQGRISELRREHEVFKARSVTVASEYDALVTKAKKNSSSNNNKNA